MLSVLLVEVTFWNLLAVSRQPCSIHNVCDNICSSEIIQLTNAVVSRLSAAPHIVLNPPHTHYSRCNGQHSAM